MLPTACYVRRLLARGARTWRAPSAVPQPVRLTRSAGVFHTQGRTGGKGSIRRKRKTVHKNVSTDDKRLQSTLKRLGVNNIPAIEEVRRAKRCAGRRVPPRASMQRCALATVPPYPRTLCAGSGTPATTWFRTELLERAGVWRDCADVLRVAVTPLRPRSTCSRTTAR